jgi:hypothetical protein
MRFCRLTKRKAKVKAFEQHVWKAFVLCIVESILTPVDGMTNAGELLSALPGSFHRNERTVAVWERMHTCHDISESTIRCNTTRQK